MKLDDYIDKRIEREGITKDDFWEGYDDYKIEVVKIRNMSQPQEKIFIEKC